LLFGGFVPSSLSISLSLSPPPGTYGDVLTVYDDDGTELAIKVFVPDDEEDDEEYSDEESSSSYDEEEYKSMDLGAAREISILRVLRLKNSHPNIIEMHDVKLNDQLMEKETNSDEMMKHMGLVMPLYSHGTLSDAIDSNIFRNKRSKVKVAYDILSAICFLHSNGIIHRDIKGENIMLDFEEDKQCFKPVLIDFSLAKVIDLQMYSKSSSTSAVENVQRSLTQLYLEDTHTASVGTPTYKAPEVVNQQPYGLPSDMYSVGVILLELLREKNLEATKDKEAAKIVADAVDNLPEQPFANLVKGLLEIDPTKRLTAPEAINAEVFVKFGLINNDIMNQVTLRTIDIKTALPFDDKIDENEKDLRKGNYTSSGKNLSKKAMINKMSSKILKRVKLIRKIAHELESKNAFTIQAALTYSEQLSQLENCDDLSESQALVDCVILAHKFFEKEMWSLIEIEKWDRGPFKECEWSAQSFLDTEETVFMLLDYCLYPRELADISPK